MHALIRRAGGIAAATLLAAAGLVVVPTAGAVQVDDVIVTDSIRVTNANGDQPLRQWNTAGVSFAFDTTGRTVATGDTFGLTFPTGFQVKTGTFDVLDEVSGEPIANCTTSPATEVAAAVECAFTDYVESHTVVRGTVTTSAQVTRTQSASSVDFLIGGTTVTVGLPGDDGILPGESEPITTPSKWGWMTDNTQTAVKWVVNIPVTRAEAGIELHLIDTLPEAVGDPTELTVQWTANEAGWEQADAWENVPVDIRSRTGGSIDVVIPGDQVRSGRIYRIAYVTPITDAAATAFTNNAEVRGAKLESRVEKETAGEGSGSGETPVPSTSATPTSTTPEVPTTVPTSTATETVTVTETETETATETATSTDVTTSTATATTTATASTTATATSTATATATTTNTAQTTVTTTETETTTVTTSRTVDVGATTSQAAPGSLDGGSLGAGSLENGSLDAGSLESGSLAGSSLGAAGSSGAALPLLLGSAALGSLGLAAVCTVPLPLPEWLIRMLPPECPAARTHAPAPAPVPVAPGPVAPNGRG